MTAREWNFDGLVGPTHNYAGLSYGNVASTSHARQVANPRAAALQGLEKMWRVMQLGVGQAVFPPLRRPKLRVLRQLGFSGSDQEVVERSWREAPELLAAAYSASSMWAANAATVSPSADCADGRLHLTPANLVSTLHRSIEADATHRMLCSIFANDESFAVHRPLAASLALADEGAANHTRLCAAFDTPGVELFVFGRVALGGSAAAPRRFPARQTREASQAITRRHGLDEQRTCFVQQSPDAIDAGVFHNDVIAVGCRDLFLCHEDAFLDQASALHRLATQFQGVCGRNLNVVQFSRSQLTLEDAVASYLFNSQLVVRGDGGMTMICPIECQESEAARRSIGWLREQATPIDEVAFLDLRQSMQNGGGPACLRLRVVLTDVQQRAMHQGVILTEPLYDRLVDWVGRHYRDRLAANDLRDPQLPREVDSALDELAGILQLPPSILFGDD